MKTILCYGDSNTYGLNPEWVHGNFGRHDINKEYVTYGVLWTEDEYIFYIDGKESGRSSNGATTDPAFMLLTCQVRINGEEHPEVLDNPENTFPAKFIVDYVRVYEAN